MALARGGLNGFLQFIEHPPMSDEANAFMGALAATGYFFPVLKIFEILSGAMLLSGRFVPLALVFLAPIILQIFLFHAFLDTAGLALPILIVILELYLGLVAYRSSFCKLLSAGSGCSDSDS
jgi:hypothetical protein